MMSNVKELKKLNTHFFLRYLFLGIVGEKPNVRMLHPLILFQYTSIIIMRINITEFQVAPFYRVIAKRIDSSRYTTSKFIFLKCQLSSNRSSS
jgi:energy-converting hydrogenase Eha subunit H